MSDVCNDSNGWGVQRVLALALALNGWTGSVCRRACAVRQQRGGGSGVAALHRKAVVMLLSAAVATAAHAGDGAQKTTGTGEVGQVVVSIKPLHALVQSVLGEKHRDKAHLLVQGYASPHGYSLKPSQVKAIHRAAAVFFVDSGFERFLNRALASAPEGVRKYPLADKAQLELLKVREGGVWEHHDHDHGEEGHHHHDAKKHHGENHHDHDHDHDAKHEHEHDHDHEHDERHGLEHDLHVWLSPDNAQRMLPVIAEELSRIYPAHKAQFVRNAEAEVRRIQALDSKLKKQLEPARNQPFIVFHDAYQYFERHYGLTAVGSITLEPGESPSVQRIREIRDKIKAHKVRCVFSEPQFSDKLLNTVITDDAVRTEQLDPLGAEVKSGVGAYSTILQNLADATLKCLR